PEPDLMVFAAGGQQPAIRGEGEAIDIAAPIRLHRLPFTVRSNVIDLDLTAAAGSQEPAVRGERNAKAGISDPCDLIASSAVEQHGLWHLAAGQEFSVRRERKRPCYASMFPSNVRPFQRSGRCMDIPEF